MCWSADSFDDHSIAGRCCVGGTQEPGGAGSEDDVPMGTRFYMRTKVHEENPQMLESATLMLVAARKHEKDGIGMVLRVSLEGSRKLHASQAVVEHIKVMPACCTRVCLYFVFISDVNITGCPVESFVFALRVGPHGDSNSPHPKLGCDVVYLCKEAVGEREVGWVVWHL